MDPREAEIDRHLAAMRTAARRMMRPMFYVVLAIVAIPLILGFALWAFMWVAGGAWRDDMSALHARAVLAAIVRAAGGCAIAASLAASVWAAIKLLDFAIDNIVFKIVADLDESIAVLSYKRHDAERVTKHLGIAGTAAFIGAAVPLIIAILRNGDLRRAVGSGLSAVIVVIATVGHYHALRKARASHHGLLQALQLEFGFVPTLSGALRVICTTAVIVIGVPYVAFPVGESIAKRLDAIPRSLIGGFESATPAIESRKSDLLADYDRAFAASLSKGVVLAPKLNVRSLPGTSADVRYHLERRAEVDVEEERGDWAFVTWSGKGGWVAKRFLKIRQVPQRSMRSFINEIMPVIAICLFSAGFVLIVCPVILLHSGKLAWSFAVSVLGTLAGNYAIIVIERYLGRQDPNSWAVITLVSLIGMIVGLTLTSTPNRSRMAVP